VFLHRILLDIIKKMLQVKGLKVSAGDKDILKGIDLEIKAGEVHCVMGPNGAGKSTLVNSLMGHPSYEILSGQANLNGVDLLGLEPFERSLEGVFLAFQYPREIAGVTLFNFLLAAYNEHMSHQDKDFRRMKAFKFRRFIKPYLLELKVPEDFLERYLNHGFSGGEKKKIEILQLKLFNPKLALLDETDSGLDVDALKVVSNGINDFKAEDKGILIVTHYQRILDYVKPDFVHVIKDGKIVKSGDYKFAQELEQKGFEWITE